jgi:drug/metabolite transporter (DMT)-like permease
MNWLIFALMAPIFWAATNVIDKFLMDKILKKIYFLPMWIGIFSIPTFAFVFLFFRPTFDFPYSIISIFIGVLYTLSYFVYAKVLMDEEVSRSISLAFVYPMIVVILAIIFLREVFSVEKYLGIFLLIISGLLVSYKKEGKKLVLIKSLKLIIMLILFWSSVQIVEKFVVGKVGNWSIYFWINVGVSLSIVPALLMKKIRAGFVNSFKETGRRGISAILMAQFFAVCSSASYYTAISLGPVSVVSSIGSLQPFFVLIYSVLLTVFVPKFLKEDLNKYNIFMKTTAVVFVLIGGWLLLG